MSGETSVRIAPGQPLFRAGDPTDCVHILKEGALEVLGEADDGAFVPVRRVEKPGSLVLEAGSPMLGRVTTVVAAVPSITVRVAVGAGGVSELLVERPEFALHLSRALAGTIRDLSEEFGAHNGRFQQLADPIDDLGRAFQKAWIATKSAVRTDAGLAEVLARLDESSLAAHARSVSAEGTRPIRARQLPRLGTEELERAGFKAEGNRFKTFPPGYEVCREGEVAHDFFFLFRGRMEATIGTVKVGTVEAGEFAGEMTVLLDKQVRTASLFTVENCRIMIIDRGGFEPLLMKEKPLLVQLVRSLLRRCESLHGQLATLHRRREKLRADLRPGAGSWLGTLDELVERLRGTSNPAVRTSLAEFQRIRSVLATRGEAL